MHLRVFYAIVIASCSAFAQLLRAPSWPLAVKNPYLNGWYTAGRNASPLNNLVVKTWNSTITPWYCSIVVDGTSYRLMDSDLNPISNTSNQTFVRITPTLTTVQGQAGPVNVTLHFLSPITVRVATPFSSTYSINAFFAAVRFGQTVTSVLVLLRHCHPFG